MYVLLPIFVMQIALDDDVMFKGLIHYSNVLSSDDSKDIVTQQYAH